jgi:hypothetical protein
MDLARARRDQAREAEKVARAEYEAVVAAAKSKLDPFVSELSSAETLYKLSKYETWWAHASVLVGYIHEYQRTLDRAWKTKTEHTREAADRKAEERRVDIQKRIEQIPDTFKTWRSLLLEYLNAPSRREDPNETERRYSWDSLKRTLPDMKFPHKYDDKWVDPVAKVHMTTEGIVTHRWR